MKKPRILYDYQTFTNQEFGGISKYFYELINNLIENESVDVDFGFKFHRNQYLKNIKSENLSVFLDSLHFKGKVRVLKYINKISQKRKFKEGNYDILHPTYYDNYFMQNNKKPYVITVYDMIHEKFNEFFKDSKKTIIEKENAILNASKIIAISNSTKQDIINYYNISEERIEVIHLATNFMNLYSYETPEHKPPYFLFVGSRAGYKNFNFMIKSLSKYFEKDYKLFCVGGSGFNNDELRLFQKLNISKNIHWYSADEKRLSSFYRDSEALIYPSLYEGFGLPIIEAFASRCIVISGKGGSMPEIGGDASIYFNYNDEISLINAVEFVINNKNLKNKIINDGLIQLENFSWSKAAFKTTNIYRSLT